MGFGGTSGHAAPLQNRAVDAVRTGRLTPRDSLGPIRGRHLHRQRLYIRRMSKPLNPRGRLGWTRQTRGRAGARKLVLAPVLWPRRGGDHDDRSRVASADTSSTLTVIGTSDVSDSGLIPNVIQPGFQKQFPQYAFKYIGTGTGNAISQAESGAGGASNLIVHAASLENQFVAGGYSQRSTATRSVDQRLRARADRPPIRRASGPAPRTTSRGRSRPSRRRASPASRRSCLAGGPRVPLSRSTRSGS